MAGNTIILWIPLKKARQQRESVSLALFRVKLHPDDGVPGHGSDQPATMIGHRRNVLSVLRREVEGMEKIGLARLDQSARTGM